MSLKEEYNKFRGKYDLPSFEELEKHFDLEDISEETNKEKILSNIRKKIYEKIDFLVEFLSSIIYLESETSAVYESGNLTKEEKSQIFKIYKILMFIKRSALKLIIESSEEREAEFIKLSFERFIKIKDQLIEFVDKIKNGWIKDENEKKKAEYFG